MCYQQRMIVAWKLRSLDLAAPSAPGRRPFLSAASGLVHAAERLYVIADDELHLGVFPAIGVEPGELWRLLDGTLPDGKASRKRHKPDFEVLVSLPAEAGLEHGALLALGSGSTPARRRGVLLPLNAQGMLDSTSLVLDLTPLFAPLEEIFAEPNIEGATWIGHKLCLFQRGNRSHPENIMVEYRLPSLVAALESGQRLQPVRLRQLDLGDVDGIPLSVTDAVALPGGGTVVTAVAEDTSDAYRDGVCVGAAVGVLDADGRLLKLERLDRPHKVEGVDARRVAGGIELLMVTDADDPNVAASLLAARIDT